MPNSCSSITQFTVSYNPTKIRRIENIAGKFSFPEDAHKILEWANITLRQGDESFLDNKLEQLRMLDRQLILMVQAEVLFRAMDLVTKVMRQLYS